MATLDRALRKYRLFTAIKRPDQRPAPVADAGSVTRTHKIVELEFDPARQTHREKKGVGGAAGGATVSGAIVYAADIGPADAALNSPSFSL